MSILVTGFNGKVGREVANKLKAYYMDMKCAVRNVERSRTSFGDQFSFVKLDLADPSTFPGALEGVDRIFLMYPPAGDIQFERFISAAKDAGILHIVYLSLKDVQYMPFIHHYKNEKLIKKHAVPYTFLRAGYFMQNLNDFLLDELVASNRIYVPAGKGRTSFVDARDLGEAAACAFAHPDRHIGKSYVLTGDEAPNFYGVAEVMSDVLGKPITYTNPTVKEFKDFMIRKGVDPGFVNVVVGIHFPTKLGLAKGIAYDYEKMTGLKPTKIKSYIEDFKSCWTPNGE